MKKTLLAGISAAGLLIGASSAFAVDDSVAVGVAGDDLALGQAVSENSLTQTAVQIAIQNDPGAGGNDNRMSFGTNTFRDQVLDNNNFNTGNNALQGGNVSIAVGVGVEN